MKKSAIMLYPLFPMQKVNCLTELFGFCERCFTN